MMKKQQKEWESKKAVLTILIHCGSRGFGHQDV